jgi:hypothetical protein
MNPINLQSASRDDAKDWVRKMVESDTAAVAAAPASSVSASNNSLASQLHLKEEKERILLSR